MKKFANWFTILAVVMIIFTCLPLLSEAQIGPVGCDPLDPGCPIDGGLSILLATGIGYGIKKIRDTRKIIKTKI